jgi:hypothetical protein
MRQFRRNDEWLAIFEDQKQSGLNIINYCPQIAISTTTFYGTRALLIGKTNRSKSSFIKATITKQTEQAVLSQEQSFMLTTAHAALELPAHYSSVVRVRSFPLLGKTQDLTLMILQDLTLMILSDDSLLGKTQDLTLMILSLMILY